MTWNPPNAQPTERARLKVLAEIRESNGATFTVETICGATATAGFRDEIADYLNVLADAGHLERMGRGRYARATG